MTSVASLAAIRAVAFDFDGVFTDNRVLVSQSGEEFVFCDRGDGMAIEFLRSAGIHLVIISKEPNPVVSARARKLSLEVHQGIDDKLPIFRQWLTTKGVDARECAYMGNDVNDVECLRHAGLAVVPSDSHPTAIAVADMVLTKPGGRGAIREFADALIAARSGSVR